MNALTAPPSSTACATLISAVASLHKTKPSFREEVLALNREVRKDQLQIPTTDAITGALLKTR